MALQSRLKRLAEYALPAREDQKTFGAWAGGAGTSIFAYASLDASAGKFVHFLWTEGWCRNDLDWVRWSRESGASSWIDEPAAIASASEEDLGNFLTAVMRGDRFTEGLLLACFNSGAFHAVIARAGVLAGTGGAI